MATSNVEAEKDIVVHVTKEEEEAREEIKEEEKKDENDQMSAVGPDGEIDWDCPCLSGMTEGPCGDTFKEAFSCFVYSEDEQKGSDCIEQFKGLHDCMQEHASYYAKDDDEEKPAEEGDKPEEETNSTAAVEEPKSENTSTVGSTLGATA